jgi:hypothetical protein
MFDHVVQHDYGCGDTDIAEWYQQRGLTALISDTYGIGASEGEPRHNVITCRLATICLSENLAISMIFEEHYKFDLLDGPTSGIHIIEVRRR